MMLNKRKGINIQITFEVNWFYPLKSTFIAVIFALGLCHCNSPKKVIKPNILWIVAEDLSQDLGCYGNTLVNTPALDNLAQNGVRFTNVFTTAPICTPSRTALATGMYQTAINAYHMRYPDELKNSLQENVLPINELLRQNGYQTLNIKDKPGTGKTDWSYKSDKAAYDYQSWDQLVEDKPFFAVVNLRLTHRPFERDENNPIDQEQVKLPPYYPDHDVAKKDWGAYLESLQLLDKQVNGILSELEIRGWSDNTIVCFFSDHGRPFTRGKSFLYDSGLKIPLIIKSPERLDWTEYLPKGTVNDQLISAIDISATTLSMVGINKPGNMQGRVVLGENKETPREYVFGAIDRVGEVFLKSRSVRSDTYKYIKNYHHDFSVNSASTAYRKAAHPIYHLLDILGERNQLDSIQRNLILPLPEEELYNIEVDPFEVVNLATDPDHQEELKRMRERLKTWQEATTDYGMQEDSPELIRAFEEYGKMSRAKVEAKTGKLRAEVLEEVIR